MQYAKERIDIIDFWVYSSLNAEVGIISPIVLANGLPNIRWVAKYKNKEERDEFFKSYKIDPKWDKIWIKHPNPDAYI
tara:strand:- start:1335 stop:1568 length:234 start_codon:yes stop_codon:yes gene_type:complete